jgi:anti-sigma B factor antagonist
MSSFYFTEGATDQGVEHDDDVVILVAGGELDYAASPQLRERMAEAITAGMRLVVDLSQATFIDSTAIGAIVGAVMRVREHEGSLAVVCAEANEHVLRTFDMAGVTGLIELYPSCQAALLALAAAD